MVAIVEGTNKAGRYILSEANFHRSRERGILVAGQNLKAGAVLAKIVAATAAPVVTAAAGNVGNGVFGAITTSAGVLPGTYNVVFIEVAANAGKFQVFNPRGILVGTGGVGVLFNLGGVSFTIADGATDFSAGDRFTFLVAVGTGKYTAYNDAGGFGAEEGMGILYEDTDATSADVAITLHARDCEILGKELNWAAMDAGQIARGIDDLATHGIIVRP